MVLQDLAAIAEIVGVVTIVVTFLFLGFQVRESNRATRASVSQAMANAQVNYTSQLILYEEIWLKVSTNQKIDDPVELRRAAQLYDLLITEMENRYVQHKLGYLSHEDWASREGATKLTVKLSIYNEWKQLPAYLTRSQEFRDYLDSLRN